MDILIQPMYVSMYVYYIHFLEHYLRVIMKEIDHKGTNLTRSHRGVRTAALQSYVTWSNTDYYVQLSRQEFQLK
jgi:hypothetical protein